ncbi:MAG: transposase family protein [Prevotellaceae bacterium]|nr:transposase family protein [Prevotellaceae bacterium]
MNLPTSLHSSFGSLYDPRINRHKLHNLLYIIIFSIFAVLSGAESYYSIDLFGKENFAFLKQFAQLMNDSISVVLV